MFVLLTALYYPDRAALINWGKPITGDSFASLHQGQIVTGIYDLLKGKGSEKDLTEWNDVIRRDENSISTRKQADTTVLSEREIEIWERAGPMIRGSEARLRTGCTKIVQNGKILMAVRYPSIQARFCSRLEKAKKRSGALSKPTKRFTC